MAEEKNFENKIKTYLKEQDAWFIKYWAGSQFTKKGIPDIIACVNGNFVAIEVKATHGKVSELQKHNIRKINEAGGYAFALYPKHYDLFKELINHLNNGRSLSARSIVENINKEALK